MVFLAVLAGVVVANRATPPLDTNTPEGVIQEYLQAVIDGNYPARRGRALAVVWV